MTFARLLDVGLGTGLVAGCENLCPSLHNAMSGGCRTGAELSRADVGGYALVGMEFGASQGVIEAALATRAARPGAAA